MKSRIVPFLIACCATSLSAEAKNKVFMLTSPDKQLESIIELSPDLTYSIVSQGDTVLKNATLGMTMNNGETWGKSPKLISAKEGSIHSSITPKFYTKERIPEDYNSLLLRFRNNWSVEFRAYNNGIAYRFLSNSKDSLYISGEEIGLPFPQNTGSIIAYTNSKGTLEQQFKNSFENTYHTVPVSEIEKERLILLPAVAELPGGKKLCFTESDLEAYPGLYLVRQPSQNGSNTTLSGIHAPYPKSAKQGGHNMLQMLVTERENYIAKTKGNRSFPWRILEISTSDKQLANSDLTYLLATPSRVTDVSWVKPGKVAWDWWNDWNLEKVPFKSGINNETYKAYIDFAAQEGIEYVILDEGWSPVNICDLKQEIPGINVRELVEYGKQKNVGIILWAGYNAFNRDMAGLCKYFSDMGVKGFKVDFMDRDDQEIVDFVHNAAATCAQYNMMLDLHGMYKPSGLNRTYPNVVNFEGVHGLEQMKWSSPSVDQVTYDVQIPFIRQVSGPMDYTQGAMVNTAKNGYYPSNSEPMSQGTRCRQLAMYVVFFSPLNMLCDSPSNYQKEKESTEFIANIPTTWDETITLDGKIGEYIVTARRKENVWYVGGMTNWEPRTLQVDLTPLQQKGNTITLFKDGINADRKATDYTKETSALTSNTLQVDLAPGGGFVGVIK